MEDSAGSDHRKPCTMGKGPSIPCAYSPSLSLSTKRKTATRGEVCSLLTEPLILPTIRALHAYFLGLKLVFFSTENHPHTLSKAFRNGNKASP